MLWEDQDQDGLMCQKTRPVGPETASQATKATGKPWSAKPQLAVAARTPASTTSCDETLERENETTRCQAQAKLLLLTAHPPTSLLRTFQIRSHSWAFFLLRGNHLSELSHAQIHLHLFPTPTCYASWLWGVVMDSSPTRSQDNQDLPDRNGSSILVSGYLPHPR